MIFFIGSVLLSSWLSIVFKYCEQKNISIFQSILVNYLVCIIAGIIFNGAHPYTSENFNSSWLKFSVILGILFITIFNVIGITTKNNGVAVASVSNKLSLVIPFCFAIFAYKEKFHYFNIIGVVLAIVAVVLISYIPKNKKIENKNNLIWPIILFLGSGIIDCVVSFVNKFYLSNANENSYIIFVFTTAFIIGLIWFIINILIGKTKLDSKAFVMGIVLGIPNYFSIWCLVNLLSKYDTQQAMIIPLNNIAIILVSSLFALILFKEKLSKINYLGIFIAVLGIIGIAFFKG